MTDQPDNVQQNIDLAAIRKVVEGQRGTEFWRSLSQLADTAEFNEFLQQEFPRQASLAASLSRRDFLKLLAAPLALAGLSACVPQPTERIMPYVEQPPEELVPGRPLFYATAMELDGYARGLLVESHLGRPIKVEGNPQHPASLGATDVYSQASILSLYDPDRAQTVTSQGRIRTLQAFQEALVQSLEFQRTVLGAGLHILTSTVTSPTLAAQFATLFDQFPQAQWHQYDPIGRDNVRAGAQLALGEYVETRYRLEQANVILSLDNHFVFKEPGSLRYLNEFASRRRVLADQTDINRLYVVESHMTTLGGFADHRLPVQAGQIEAFARVLARQLGLQIANGESETGITIPDGWLDGLVSDLQNNQGSSLIMVGSQQPPAVHALAHALNAALGNVGQTIFYTNPVEANPVDQTESLTGLAQALEAGQVDILLVFDGNPVFTAPADLNFRQLFTRARLSVYLGLYEDETAALSSWHIPAKHYLEMWSDTRAYDGTISIIQPLILPLYNGVSHHELLAIVLGQPGATDYDIVRQFWQNPTFPWTNGTPGRNSADQSPNGSRAPGDEAPAGQSPGTGEPESGSDSTAAGAGQPTDETGTGTTAAPGGATAVSDFEREWNTVLRAGFIPNSALAERQVNVQLEFLARLNKATSVNRPDGQTLEIIFEPDPSIWDGRFANNAWLQELPKPITKLVWDNAALISPSTAQQLDVANNDLVELRYRSRTVRAPILILPGQPDGSVTVYLGYGRERGGRVLDGNGFNAYALRATDTPWFGYGLEVHKTGQRYQTVTTQDHFSMEGRDLVKVAEIEEFRQNPEIFYTDTHGLIPHGEPPPSLYPEFAYEGYAWGMAINQNACIGCNACVIACQAENNVPVVGKNQVENAREMHWLRIDTYFRGRLENPETYFQPMLCMHCEKAPCEPVCPVEATVHSSEGLNEMVYNRCVGTRYCSNNCPYKVRRFNFLQYIDQDVIPLQMLRNPDVTVRERGVMEKCTYCVQRINAARIDAKTEGRRIQDGEVVTACAQACPTQAIIFGDINDSNSQVHQLKAQPHHYDLLEELGTQPRTFYLAKLRNPNPLIPNQE